MYERHHSRGNYLPDDAVRTQPGNGGPPKRPHRLNVRVDAALYRALRAEADASGLPLSSVLRLALGAGVEAVRDARATRGALAGIGA